MIETVARDPLRHAVARGRQPARHRRGGRPRHLRLQVPRSGTGRPGARGRGGGRRPGRAARPAHSSDGGARPGPGDRPLRGGRGGPGPAQRQPRPQPRHGLPARIVRLRRRATGGRRPGAGPVAGRVHGQRRPHLAQPQPAALARGPVGHRPRSVPLLPPRLVGRRRRPRPVRRPALVAGRPRLPRARRRAGARRRRGAGGCSAPTSSPRCWRTCRTPGSSPCRAPTHRTPCARRTSRS